MTKINKLGKSTFVIAILSFLLVAVLAFGGTYAYFSDTSNDVTGSVNLGRLQITDFAGKGADGSIKIEAEVAQPNQTIINDTITADIDANIKYYVRVYFTAEVTECTTAETSDGTHDFTHSHTCTTEETGGDKVTNDLDILTIVVGDGTWAEYNKTGYYYLTSAATAQTAETQSITVNVTVNEWVGVNGCNYWMDAKVELTVTMQVLQAEHLKDANITDAASLHDAWNGYVAKAKTV